MAITNAWIGTDSAVPPRPGDIAAPVPALIYCAPLTALDQLQAPHLLACDYCAAIGESPHAAAALANMVSYVPCTVVLVSVLAKVYLVTLTVAEQVSTDLSPRCVDQQVSAKCSTHTPAYNAPFCNVEQSFQILDSCECSSTLQRVHSGQHTVQQSSMIGWVTTNMQRDSAIQNGSGGMAASILTTIACRQ
jgi:hypothetical protein